MKTPKCSTCSSASCFIKFYTNATWKKKIEKEKVTLNFKKGETIFREGDPVGGVYFIFKGKVKVHRMGMKQKTHIVRLAGAGKILGHRGFGKINTYPIGATAIEDSVICFIPRATFIDAITNNPELSLELMNFYAQELRRAENKLVSLSQMTVKQKIAETIITLAEIHGSKKSAGVEYLNVELTRQEYADITGASIEEVIRTLSLLNKQKLIKLDGRKIVIIERAKLEKMLVDFGSLKLP